MDGTPTQPATLQHAATATPPQDGVAPKPSLKAALPPVVQQPEQLVPDRGLVTTLC